MMIRQGDILLIPIKQFPKGLKEKDKVIARGEVTGHNHRFESKQVNVFADEEGNQFADVRSPSKLIHEEHGELEIPVGKFKIVLQREFDVMEGARQVMD